MGVSPQLDLMVLELDLAMKFRVFEAYPSWKVESAPVVSCCSNLGRILQSVEDHSWLRDQACLELVVVIHPALLLCQFQ
jgi:hypothetical protein